MYCAHKTLLVLAEHAGFRGICDTINDICETGFLITVKVFFTFATILIGANLDLGCEFWHHLVRGHRARHVPNSGEHYICRFSGPAHAHRHQLAALRILFGCVGDLTSVILPSDQNSSFLLSLACFGGLGQERGGGWDS